MESLPISRKRLCELVEEAKRKQKEDAIANVIREITSNAVSYAKKGLTTYTYPRCKSIRPISIEIIAMLKKNFPDCDIQYRINDLDDEIIIDWSQEFGKN
jgi:hypothetical protein